MVSRGSRNLILGVLFVIAAVLSWRAITSNRQRRELVAVEKRLDAELVKKREAVKELERYREDLAALERRLAELRQRMSPDLGVLEGELEPFRVSVHRGEARDGLNMFTLTGTASSPLAVALPEIARVLSGVQAIRIEVGDAGWRADFAAPAPIAMPAPIALPPDPPEVWYGFLNATVKERVRAKRSELAELDRRLGNVNSYWSVKEEVEMREAMIAEAAKKGIDLVRLAIVFFATEPRLFATGSLEHSQADLRGGLIGRLARPIKDPDLIALFGPELHARIVRGYADTVEVAFQKN